MLRTRRIIAVIAASLALILGAVAAPSITGAQANTGVLIWTTTLTNGDAADVYIPNGTNLPFALMMQGANVDKQYYSGFATVASQYGIIVIVPNHVSTVPNGLYEPSSEINVAYDWALAQASTSTAPLYGKLDATRMGLFGHSYGGASSLYAIGGKCQPPFCYGTPITLPTALKAAALYGTNSVVDGTAAPINLHVPTTLVNGSVDGLAALSSAQATFAVMSGAPKGLLTFTGTNHYGICNVNDPPGAIADPNSPTTNQSVGYADIARWSAQWVLANMGNQNAVNFIYGNNSDPLVSRLYG